MAKRATINDVAHLAGVSIMTVSRVIREQPNVRPETRRRVQEAIKKLDYHPSFSARALSKSVTGNVGLLISHKKRFDDIYSYITIGIENECRLQNYSLMTFTSPIDFGQLPPMITQRKVDGLIVGGAGITKALLHQLESMGLPLVLIDHYACSEALTCILPDDFEGAYQAVKYLVSLGHRCIAFVCSGNDHHTSRRLQGYKLALLDANLKIEKRFIYWTSPGLESLAEIVEDLKSSQKPTAIFCSDDSLARDMLQVLREKHIDVPRQISVIGFGNFETSTMTRPALTTVHVDKEFLGTIAVHRLLDIFRYRDVPATKVLLPTRLVVRESCMPVN